MRDESEFPKLRKTGPTMTVLRAMFNGGAAREFHGYELAKQLRSHQSAYAVFRKLEKLDLVTSWWDDTESSYPRRRYYRLTGLGIDYCRHLFAGEADTGQAPAWSPT